MAEHDIPGPDWEKAPAWAGWWALDREGDAYWWEHQPFYNESNGWWLCPLSNEHCQSDKECYCVESDEECYCVESDEDCYCVEFDSSWSPIDRNQIIDCSQTLRRRP